MRKMEKLALFGGEKAKTVPYGKGKRFGEEELVQLREALEQNTLFYWYGKKTKQLCEKFANMCGTKYCLGTSSGTSAIHVALGAVGVLQIGIEHLVVDVDLIAALHPQFGLDQTVDVVAVGLLHLVGVVDKGMVGGHLAVGAFHRDGYRLLGRGQERLVELQNGSKLRVQFGNVVHLYRDTVTLHKDAPPC